MSSSKIDKGSLMLEGERVRLQPLTVKDICDEYVNGLNNPEVNKYLVSVRTRTQTRGTVEEFVRSNHEDPSSILFGIFVKDIEEPFVGTVRISEIDPFHYFASVGVCLFAKRVWKRGYALESINLVKDYLFNVLGLHYIEAGMYAKNAASINLFMRAGFVEQYRVQEKYRREASFEEAVLLFAVNQSFDMSLLEGKSPATRKV